MKQKQRKKKVAEGKPGAAFAGNVWASTIKKATFNRKIRDNIHGRLINLLVHSFIQEFATKESIQSMNQSMTSLIELFMHEHPH